MITDVKRRNKNDSQDLFQIDRFTFAQKDCDPFKIVC